MFCVAPILLSALLISTAFLILPKYCGLFDNTPPWCDTFEVIEKAALEDPNPCRACDDQRMVLLARILAGLGAALILLPIIICLRDGYYENK